jgi:hypothetical protein
MNPPATGFTSFREFYPYYLSEHADRTCRRLHFVGTTLVIGIVITSLVTQPSRLCSGWLLWLATDSPGWAITFSRKTGPPPLSTPFIAFGGTL